MVSAIQQVNSAILAGQFTNEQLDSITMAIKYARSQLRNQIKYTLRVGDSVEFTSSKSGMNLQGTIQKIAIKYVTVKTAQGLWRVPANMLRQVEAA